MTRHPRDAWSAALHVIEKLRANGHIALLAGGCVRDRLLGQSPKDYDVATDATPQRVKQLYPRSRKVGAKFGVVLVRMYGHDVEVATFRSDGSYSNGRHPDQVCFGSETEDARRRDFTINGLFFDPIEDRVIDHVSGRADLEARVLRTIGDPDQRFQEDHLRMLRAIRFAVRLGFTIEPTTLAAIRRLAGQLRAISAERIWQELEAILTAPTRALGWRLLVDTGLRHHLQSRWRADAEEDRTVHRRLAALPSKVVSVALATAAVLASRPRNEVRDVCRALRLANRLLNAVTWLVGSLPAVRNGRALELADLKVLMAHPSWEDLLELLRADLVATEAGLDGYDFVRRWSERVPADRVAPPPLLNGGDLERIGIEPGPRFGALLDAVYRAQLNEVVDTRAQALSLLHTMTGPGGGRSAPE